MNLRDTRHFKEPMQFCCSIAMVLLVAGICFPFAGIIGYRVVALLLLLCVSLLAVLFDIFPVLIAAVLSALTWNFFFIPPVLTFHIHGTENILLFFMYFVIALVNAALTFKIRSAEKKARDKEEKENAIKLYNTLLSSLSHEMRTPLAAIMSAVDTLKENDSPLSKDLHADLLNEIDLASLRLNRQVENLLNMNRLEAGILQVKKDWCDVNELVFLVIGKFPPGNAEQSIIFEPDEQLPLFRLDAGLVEQVLYNLVHNALQHNTKVKVYIHVELLDDQCIIKVSDDGKGFPGKDIPFVFDKFYRVHGSKAGGTGLGLSIVKGFTEAHGGTIKLDSDATRGTVFTISIPSETSFIANLTHE